MSSELAFVAQLELVCEAGEESLEAVRRQREPRSSRSWKRGYIEGLRHGYVMGLQKALGMAKDEWVTNE